MADSVAAFGGGGGATSTGNLTMGGSSSSHSFGSMRPPSLPPMHRPTSAALSIDRRPSGSSSSGGGALPSGNEGNTPLHQTLQHVIPGQIGGASSSSSSIAPRTSTGSSPAAAPADRWRESKIAAKFRTVLEKYSNSLLTAQGTDPKLQKVCQFASEIVKNAEKQWNAINKDSIVKEFEQRAQAAEVLRQARLRHEVGLAQLRHVRMVKPEAHNTALKANLQHDLSQVQQIAEQAGSQGPGRRALEEYAVRLTRGAEGVAQDLETLKKRKKAIIEKEKDLVRIENQIMAQPDGNQLEQLLYGVHLEKENAIARVPE